MTTESKGFADWMREKGNDLFEEYLAKRRAEHKQDWGWYGEWLKTEGTKAFEAWLEKQS